MSCHRHRAHPPPPSRSLLPPGTALQHRKPYGRVSARTMNSNGQEFATQQYVDMVKLQLRAEFRRELNNLHKEYENKFVKKTTQDVVADNETSECYVHAHNETEQASLPPAFNDVYPPYSEQQLKKNGDEMLSSTAIAQTMTAPPETVAPYKDMRELCNQLKANFNLWLKCGACGSEFGQNGFFVAYVHKTARGYPVLNLCAQCVASGAFKHRAMLYLPSAPMAHKAKNAAPIFEAVLRAYGQINTTNTHECGFKCTKSGTKESSAHLNALIEKLSASKTFAAPASEDKATQPAVDWMQLSMSTVIEATQNTDTEDILRQLMSDEEAMRKARVAMQKSIQRTLDEFDSRYQRIKAPKRTVQEIEHKKTQPENNEMAQKAAENEVPPMENKATPEEVETKSIVTSLNDGELVSMRQSGDNASMLSDDYELVENCTIDIPSNASTRSASAQDLDYESASEEAEQPDNETFADTDLYMSTCSTVKDPEIDLTDEGFVRTSAWAEEQSKNTTEKVAPKNNESIVSVEYEAVEASKIEELKENGDDVKEAHERKANAIDARIQAIGANLSESLKQRDGAWTSCNETVRAASVSPVQMTTRWKPPAPVNPLQMLAPGVRASPLTRAWVPKSTQTLPVLTADDVRAALPPAQLSSITSSAMTVEPEAPKVDNIVENHSADFAEKMCACLAMLNEMGFCDTNKNAELLMRHDFSVAEVVSAYLGD